MPPIISRQCDYCHQSYIGFGKKYCSGKCRGLAEIVFHLCKQCGHRYLGGGTKRQFCTRTCWYRWSGEHPGYVHRNRNHVITVCDLCGKTYRPDHPNRVGKHHYCSLGCLKIVWDAKTAKSRELRTQTRVRNIRIRKVPRQDKRDRFLFRYYNIVCRSRKTGKEYLSKSEFFSWKSDNKMVCAYCDIPEELMEVAYPNRYFSRLHIDRKDNEVGYLINNITWSCMRCNIIKSDVFSFDEMRTIAQQYIKPKWQRAIRMDVQPLKGGMVDATV